MNKETFASQLRLASNHQMVPGYMLGLAYTQSITPRFSMGGETTLNINSLQVGSPHNNGNNNDDGVKRQQPIDDDQRPTTNRPINRSTPDQ